MNENFMNDIDENKKRDYIKLKNEGINLLENNKYYNARDNLLKAYEIYKKDAELLKLIGVCYYFFYEFDDSLKYYKAAYEINNNDVEVCAMMGRILLLKENFLEAIYYFKQVLNYVTLHNSKYKCEILRNLGYCYYYSDDYINSKYYFNESLKLDRKDKESAKFIKNITKKLEGKNVKKIENYTKYKLPNNQKKQPKEKRTGLKKFKAIASAILTLFSIGSFIEYGYEEAHNNKDNKSSYEVKSNANQNDNLIENTDDFIKLPYNMPVSMIFTDIKPTEYYELAKKLNEKYIYSKEEIDRNNWWDNVECRLYTGSIGQVDRCIFSIPMDDCSKADKKGQYNVDGAKYAINNELYNKIVDETVNSKRYRWIFAGFITSQKNLKEEAVKIKNSSFINDNGQTVKVISTEDEFTENNYSEFESVYLSDIIPLDYYLYHEDEKNSSFLSLTQIKYKGIDENSCVQMYCGKLGDIQVGFINPKFSLSKVDDKGGYNVEGRKSCMGISSQEINVYKNYNGKTAVNISPWFIESEK